MRRMVVLGAAVVLVVLGLGGCQPSTPSNLDVERRMAAEAYRIERGDWAVKASDVTCTPGRYHDGDVGAFVVTECVVKGFKYHLQANYAGPKGRRTDVDIRATYTILPSQLVVKCGFRYDGQRWNVGRCVKGDFVPR